MIVTLVAFTSLGPSLFAIVPGAGIGRVQLNHPVPHVLGSSTFDDGAMAHIWSMWKAGANTLDTYTVLGDKDHLVVYVRVTSPEFKTARGMHTGDTWGSIKIHYPSANTKTYQSKQFNRKLAIMDSKKGGIAFEVTLNGAGQVFGGSKCLAIWVHAKGAALDPSTWLVFQSARP